MDPAGVSRKLVRIPGWRGHFTMRVSWMSGNWSGCWAEDIALVVTVIVEVPEGVTMGGGVTIGGGVTEALPVLPQPAP